ncbi:hypothetical protein ACSSS7_006255 [Eimeria intestinalis]
MPGSQRGTLREATTPTGPPLEEWQAWETDAGRRAVVIATLQRQAPQSLQEQHQQQQHERLYADAAWSNEAPLESTYNATYKPPPAEGFTPLLLPHLQQQQQQQREEMRKRSVAACIVDEKLGLL